MEREAVHYCWVIDDFSCLEPTTNNDSICRCGVFKHRLGFYSHAIHRRNLSFWATNRRAPIWFLDSVQDAKRDERVKLIEPLKGKNGDMHFSMILTDWL